MGKTVIVVTHDDTYFNCGERLIKFDYGNVVSDTQVNAASDLHYAS
jgi:ABC-type siderophore export system fused ATPase/permease subunit